MLHYESLPNPGMAGGLELYFQHGIEPGSFLTAVLSNDLRGAAKRADGRNQRLLFEHVRWLYNEAPNGSWGSAENFKRWVESGGMSGQESAQRKVIAAARGELS